MTEDLFVEKMARYMPEVACRISYQWLTAYPCKIRITKPRTSKLGDFRVMPGSPPLITINGNLNPYSFAITFAHEMAHLIDFKKRNTLRDPHGDSWKTEYVKLVNELYVNQAFPAVLNVIITNHMRSPKAASCSDSDLLEGLKMFDERPTISLNQLPDESIFSLPNGRIFKKGELRRTRYRCIELASSRAYLVHMHSEVELLG